MEQFSLEKYLKNPSRKIVTREGKPARIICTDAKFEKYPVLALITRKDGRESLATLDTSGKSCSGCNSHLDLFFDTNKHEGWVNVYMNCNERSLGALYSSKKDALEIAKANDNYVATVKIEWEE